jgi:hypothetical protein
VDSYSLSRSFSLSLSLAFSRSRKFLNRYDIVTRSNVDIDVIQMSGSFSVDTSKAETVVAKNSRLVKGSVAAT